jgi:gluconolactonase
MRKKDLKMKKKSILIVSVVLFLLLLCLVLLTGNSKKYFRGKIVPVADSLSFPEGPSWYRGHLVFSNAYGGWIGQLYREELDTLLNERNGLINTNGTVFDRRGNLYICDYGKKAILKYSPGGKVRVLSDRDNEGRTLNRPNDITISPTGTLYFTDPKSYDPAAHDGRLYRLNPESGETIWLIEGLQFPNGLCLSPDGKYLYVGESVNKNILRITSRLGQLDTLITLPRGNQDPDGMDCDIHGNLYIAYYGGGKIYVVSPEGVLLDSLLTPGKKPSNVEFGGTDMKTLYITECENNAIYAIRTRYPGYEKNKRK